MAFSTPVLLTFLGLCCLAYGSDLSQRDLDHLRQFLRNYEARIQRNFGDSSQVSSPSSDSYSPSSATGYSSSSSSTTGYSSSSSSATGHTGSSSSATGYSSSSSSTTGYSSSSSSATGHTGSSSSSSHYYTPSPSSDSYISSSSTSDYYSPTPSSVYYGSSSSSIDYLSSSSPSPVTDDGTSDSSEESAGLHAALNGLLMATDPDMDVEDYLEFLADATCIVADLVKAEHIVEDERSGGHVSPSPDSGRRSGDKRKGVRWNRGVRRGVEIKRSHYELITSLCDVIDGDRPMQLSLLSDVLIDFIMQREAHEESGGVSGP